MITVRLHGRMGNQLFEYAAARALADARGTDVAVDERMLNHMGDASARAHFAWSVQDSALPPFRYERPLAYLRWRYFGGRPAIRREAGYHADFLEWPDNTYLHGYWQREVYFRHLRKTLLAECRITTPPSPANAAMAQRIASTLSVALHVRRGDFLDVAPDQVCSERYYANALATLRERLAQDPTVFVFSDDPAWAHAHLPLPYEKVVVDLNGPEADYEDLRLMASCQHNVISNSTFSWWGAWLNQNDAKIVVGPGDPNAPTHDSDYLVDGWLRARDA